MIASLTAVAAALGLGLPLLALGELIRERKERRLRNQHTSPNRRDTP
jgi:hypothetical protein